MAKSITRSKAQLTELFRTVEADFGKGPAYRRVGIELKRARVPMTVDDLYRMHPADEPESTRRLLDFTLYEAMYPGDCDWLKKAVRRAMKDFDWAPEQLSEPWQQFIARLLASDADTQRKALLAALEANPANEPFLEDLFALCEAVEDARPTTLQHQVNGRWPDPAITADEPLKPIERALDIKLNSEA
jgi:hypothetical protein